MFDLCLFDLDNTLLRTDDLKEIRERGVGRQEDASYRNDLLALFGDATGRYIYKPQDLAALKERWPNMKFGIFTRAPEAYAMALLREAYKNFDFDIRVAYETVPKGLCKPNGWGIRACMNAVGVAEPNKVVLVGDESVDVRAAYNAGVYVILDKSSWSTKWRDWDRSKHWDALKLLPDAVIEAPASLPLVLADIEAYALKMERGFGNSVDSARQSRFEEFSNLFPREVGEEGVRIKINYAGRHFSNYASLDARRAWHALTRDIHLHKESQIFPVQWCNTVYEFVRKSFPLRSLPSRSVIVSAIPPRPGRAPRMQHFIAQLHADFLKRQALGRTVDAVQFNTTLLCYREGVRSQSGDHLNRVERFENIRDHLFVTDPTSVVGKDFVIIDDVCTSGATLMYAQKRLLEAGARNVALLALAKNVTDVL